MLRRLVLTVLLALWPALASAQLAFVAPSAPSSDNGDRIANTAWVQNFFATGLPLASGKIIIGSAGGVGTAQTMSGDCTLVASGVITCTPPITQITGLGAGVATWLGTPSGANLLAALTTKTGTGLPVFGTAPNITAPTGIVKADVGLGNVANVDTTNAANISTGALAKARGGTGGVNGALSVLAFGNAASVAGGATVFFGQGASGASDSQYVMIPVAGTLSNLTAQTNNQPAGVQTYTITLDSSTVPSTLTCTITGATSACSDNVHTVSVSQGAFMSIKEVASATAATSAGNYFSVVFTPN